MDGDTAGNRGQRLAITLFAVLVVAVLAAAFRVHTRTSFSTGSGPAGSAAYRQEIAFVRCMRSHGLAGLPDPPPGDSVSVPLPQNGFGACQHLAPGGRDTTNIQVTL